MLKSLCISKRYLYQTSRVLNSAKAPNPFELLMKKSPDNTTSKKPNRFSLQYDKSSPMRQNNSKNLRKSGGGSQNQSQGQFQNQGKGQGQVQTQGYQSQAQRGEFGNKNTNWRGNNDNNGYNNKRSVYSNRNERANRVGSNGQNGPGSIGSTSPYDNGNDGLRVGGSRGGPRGSSGDKHRPSMRFENRTGSAKAQEALKQMILRVYEANTGFKVNYRNPEGKLELIHLLQITNELDLNEEGISVRNSGSDANLPIVSKIPAKVMLQLYSDELAAKVEDRLLASGSAHAQKVVDSRLKVERKKSATKMVNLAWTISISDMQKQKRKEIEKRISAGERFTIIMGDKASISKRKKQLKDLGDENEGTDAAEEEYSSGLNHLDDEEYELEIKKRERLFETVESILAEHRCRNSISGSLERQMFVSVEPIKVTTQDQVKLKKKEELSPKELRRLKRLEKAKGADSGNNGDDLDAMYLFKIDD